MERLHISTRQIRHWVPLFPELREELEALWSEREAVWFELPENKRQFVILRYRDASQNLRTTFEKIVRRAGLPDIPSPFRNLRKTRSNEVERQWGKERESAWIGHSHQVWKEHYSEIMDSDIEAAAEWTTPNNAGRSASNGWKNLAPDGFPPIFPPEQGGMGLQGVERVQMANVR